MSNSIGAPNWVVWIIDGFILLVALYLVWSTASYVKSKQKKR